MKKTQALALFTIIAIGISGVSYAWMGPMSEMTEEDKAAFQETRDQLQTAIQNGDYETWFDLMQGKFSEMTSEENFQAIQERHGEKLQLKEQMQEAIQNGDYELARELKAQFGGPGKHRMGMQIDGCPMQG